MTIVRCPRCRDEVTIPAKAPLTALVRCPLCHEKYLLSEAASQLPPALILVVSELASALVLLVGAALVIQSLQNLNRVDKGFSAENVFTVDGVSVYMTHIGGYPGHYAPQARANIEKHRPALFICGHSHICKVMRDDQYGLLHINPGAAGRHGMHKFRTAVRFIVDAGKISELEVIELGLRTRLEA